MLKLSEATPVTSQLLKTLLGQLFSEEMISVSLGSAEVGVAFSQQPFDHLLFTGATSVGRYVMRAAAENLTPVTLELGGKSPAIISTTVPMAQAAERIAFGKAMNAGQTCVAPDYVLVPRTRLDDFTTAYREAIQHLFPKLEDNPDYTSIINDRQLQRLTGYILDAEQKGAEIIPLFPALEGRRLPHTLILNPCDDMDVMREEIFGPLLPVVTYDRIEEALHYVTERPRPLALYYFGHDRKEQERVLYQTHSGGVCLNDTLMHVAQDDLPFGGVGQSGMGHYHGHEGFLTFSHAKSVFSKGGINSARLIYPPYGKTIQKIIYWLYLR
jgi:coniferyl-aldehyde dehydrogenase